MIRDIRAEARAEASRRSPAIATHAPGSLAAFEEGAAWALRSLGQDRDDLARAVYNLGPERRLTDEPQGRWEDVPWDEASEFDRRLRYRVVDTLLGHLTGEPS